MLNHIKFCQIEFYQLADQFVMLGSLTKQSTISKIKHFLTNYISFALLTHLINPFIYLLQHWTKSFGIFESARQQVEKSVVSNV